MGVAPRIRGAAIGQQVPHLFLSHSSKDNKWVTELAEDLNLCGVDVWFDAWELRVGDDLHERIADAVDKSRFVAVVVTKHFSESKWIRGEVHQALSREKAGDRTVVLPLLADDAEVPPLLSTKKFLDFSGDYFGSLTHLAALIHELAPDAVEGEMRLPPRPNSVRDCIKLLERAGWTSRHVFGTAALAEIERNGGSRKGDVVHFSPEWILPRSNISSSLRRLLEKLQ
jgi:hypothetical protein